MIIRKYGIWAILGFLVVSFLSSCSSMKDAEELYQKGDNPKALKMAIGFLSDSDPEVRIQAAQLVGKIGGEQAAKALLVLLKDKVEPVVIAGIEALGQTRYPAVGGDLTKMVPTAKGPVFDALAKTFRQLGEGAIDSLVSAFNAQDSGPSWKAYRDMLLQIGPVVSKSIAKSFKGKTPAENEEKLKVLVELRSPSVPGFLIEMLGDPEVSDMVVRSLVQFGSMSVDPAIAELTKYEGSEKDAVIKELLCRALGDIKSRRAVPILEKMAKDPSDLVRGAADMALQKIRGF